MTPPPRGSGDGYYGSISSSNNGPQSTTTTNEEETAPLMVGSESFNNKQETSTSTHQLLKKKVLWVVAAVAALLCGLLIFHHHDATTASLRIAVTPTVPSSSNRSSSSDDDDSSTISKTSSSSLPHIKLPSPTKDMDWLRVVQERSEASAMPSRLWGNVQGPLPTNSWYLNLLSHRAADSQPDDETRVYTIPYIVDTAAAASGLTAGLRVHWPVLLANANNIQMVNDYKNGISLGTVSDESDDDDISAGNDYRVLADQPLSPLAVSLEWSGNNSNNNTSADDSSTTTKRRRMVSHIVRGMPYATMKYYGGILPSLYSYNGPASALRVDDTDQELPCTTPNQPNKARKVNRMLQMHLINSDFTWAVWFSRPVQVACRISEGPEEVRDLRLNVVGYDSTTSADEETDEPLTVRLALLNQCTTGKSDITQHCLERASWENPEAYEQILKEHVNVIPTNPQIDFDFWSTDATSSTTTPTQQGMTIDWGAQTSAATDRTAEGNDKKLLMFALPHHQEQLTGGETENNNDETTVTEQCIHTFHGPTCLVLADTWKLQEPVTNTQTNGGLIRPMSFTAPRPPHADAIPKLAEALSEDIHYRLSSNLLRGAADTYFSGKILARMARVILIASELQALASAHGGKSVSSPAIQELYGSGGDGDELDKEWLLRSMEAAAAEDLPSQRAITAAVDKLRQGVEVWLSDRCEAPYVFDEAWGGLVNCGCRYVGEGEHGVCENTFPDCPALVDVNEDFGNGLYNDHHYHLGYSVYAAAVVARFDPEWAKKNFDRVLLYVRDFANPFPDDDYFTPFRQKDWFLGSSWASGLVSAENSPHGRNEESSSEAISAYEGVTLFGSIMVDVFSSSPSIDENKLRTARLVRDAGQFLTATEIRATNRYWHVWSSDAHTNTYPKAYTQPVVGMLYDTMASFQTWFAPQAVVSYGIQLMPLTPVAEKRDDPDWAAELYPLYVQSCKQAGEFCIKNGWSILQAGLCATAGQPEKAMDQALAIPPAVFNSLGGVGNSLSNTIWFIATRETWTAATAA